MLEILQQFLVPFWHMFLGVLFNPILVLGIILILIYVKKNKDYKASAYYQITKVPFFSIRHDLGRYGEYLTYKRLKCFENDGAKFLFNVYIPKDNGETTEIDVLMISPKGIFVFESKNYSGWIFGSENQKNWYQTLPTGKGRSRKEHFYNPIMQNCSHIKHLKLLIGEQFPTYSIIVFSERCTLKSITLKYSDAIVIKRDNVLHVVSDIYERTSEHILSEKEIINLYEKLYPFTQVSDAQKTQHIANIQNKLATKSSVSVPNDNEPTPEIKDVSRENVLEEVRNLSTNKPDEANNAVFQKEVVNETSAVELDNDKPQTCPDEVKKTPTNICPKCGGKLIMKTAAKGANKGNQFWGCANFPKCRYIKNAEQPQ